MDSERFALATTSYTAFVARLADTDELVGIVRADATPRSAAAELGISIADAWQNRGVGSALLARLIEAGRASGFSSLVAEVLPANTRMQRLLRRHGFVCTAEPDGNALDFRLSLRDEAA